MNDTLNAHRKTIVVTESGRAYLYFHAKKDLPPRLIDANPRTTVDYKSARPAETGDVTGAYNALLDVKGGFALPPMGADMPKLIHIIRAEQSWMDCDFVLIAADGAATLVTTEEVRKAMSGRLRYDPTTERAE